MGNNTSRQIWDGGYGKTHKNGGMVSAEISLELDGSGNVIAKYIRGLNILTSEIDNVTSYYLFNAHGDVVQLTDELGIVTKSYSYSAFGVETDPDPNDTNPFRYCAEYFDLSSGTYYIRARYYDPTTSRWLSPDSHWNPTNMIYGDEPVKWNEREANPRDPLGLNTYAYLPNMAAIMQSGNLYVYCGNNPVMYVDPSGEIFMLVTAAIGAVAGAVVGGVVAAATGNNVWAGIGIGAVAGGVIGLTGGAAVAFVATGSATASTGAVMAGLGVAGVTGATAAGGSGALATNQASRMIYEVIPNRIDHIMQTKHAWNLVGANNWSAVSNVINSTLTQGAAGPLNTAGNVVYTYVYNNYTVEVTTRVINGIIQIVDAWVKTI